MNAPPAPDVVFAHEHALSTSTSCSWLAGWLAELRGTVPLPPHTQTLCGGRRSVPPPPFASLLDHQPGVQRRRRVSFFFFFKRLPTEPNHPYPVSEASFHRCLSLIVRLWEPNVDRLPPWSCGVRKPVQSVSFGAKRVRQSPQPVWTCGGNSLRSP